MPWDDESRWDGEMLEHHRALIALRRSHEALRGQTCVILVCSFCLAPPSDGGGWPARTKCGGGRVGSSQR